MMWILTWIAVGIGGVLGAASILMLNASHRSGGQSPSVIGRTGEPAAMVNKQKTGEPSRSLIVASHRQRLASE